MKVAEDVVLCLDLATGKTLWKCKSPGEATGRMASSTPCVADGRVYALGSTHFYAVDAQQRQAALVRAACRPKAPRRRRWSWTACWSSTPANWPRSTPRPASRSGRSRKAGGGNSSPVAWKSGDRTVVICNGRGVLAGVDLKIRRVALDDTRRRRLHARDRRRHARRADHQPQGGHPGGQADRDRFHSALEHCPTTRCARSPARSSWAATST